MNSIPSSMLLRISGIWKRYDASQVLRDVSLELRKGESLALLGENGAGKSTLIKVLSGAVEPDRGFIELEGKQLSFGRPDLVRQAGVAVVYQELSLCPHLTVEQNVNLGNEAHRFGWLTPRRQRTNVERAVERLGKARDFLDQRVSDLSVGEKQLVEIARALAQDAKVLVLDEPTSSLSGSDTTQLFAVLDRLLSEGIGLIYISHFLEEIRRVCKSYVVLRDGEVVGNGSLDLVDSKSLVRLMVGRDIDQLYPVRAKGLGDSSLQLRNLQGEKLAEPVSLESRRGEIIGIAGLIGSGRTELLRLVYGLDRKSSGHVEILGKLLSTSAGPRESIDAGFAMISEDRKEEGLAQNLTIRDNLTLSRLRPYTWFGWIDEFKRGRATDELARRFEVKTNSIDAPIWTLSGGNQQKVALARAMHQNADLWLMDEPTRGIDVGTKAEIYRMMSELAEKGFTILFVSSYFQELLATCDRIVVLSKGRMVADRPTSEWTEAGLAEAAMGQSQSSVSASS